MLPLENRILMCLVLSTVLSPLLAGIAIGFALYVSKPGNLRLFIAISIASVGFAVGIIWAIKISRKKRIFDYTTTAKSPDFDKI
jgi:membrane associated rhomboid family serine protease